MATPWSRDDGALALLAASGEPFNAPDYRRAWTEAVAGWTDVSFGARLSDGTQAAIALLQRRRMAQSLPLGYGGIVASRPLEELEVSSFLLAARRAVRVIEVRAFSVAVDPSSAQPHPGGHVLAQTSVLYLDRDAGPNARLTKRGREAIARAERAGGSAGEASDDPEPFLELYERASRDWNTRYPADLLRHLAGGGLMRLYYAALEGVPEASAVALRGERHWMYWLAAQSDAGRDAELGYAALAALVADAHAAGVCAVNLGASAGLPGVASFKRRFGGVDVDVTEHRSGQSALATAHRAAGAGYGLLRRAGRSRGTKR